MSINPIGPQPPQVIRVGDPTIDWISLPIGHDRKRVLLVEGESAREVGTTSETVDLLNVDGRPVVRRTQTLDAPALEPLSVDVELEAATFAPMHVRLERAGLSIDVVYAEKGVEARLETPDGPGEPAHLPVELPVFDGFSVELILRVLPLAPGYAAELSAYLAQSATVETVAIRVAALEAADTGGGVEESAWRVEVDFGEQQSTYWIHQVSRAILRQDTPLSTGATLSFRR